MFICTELRRLTPAPFPFNGAAATEMVGRGKVLRVSDGLKMYSRIERCFPLHPAWLLVLQAAALWPIWLWYARRSADGSDEPWGLLALVAVLLFAYIERRHLREQSRPILLAFAAGLTLLGASVTPWAPALLRAGLGVTALSLSFAALHDRSRPLLPLWAMLLLSLPVVASLQFYLGYPLRALTAWCSAALLRLGGLDVEQAGTTLSWLGRTVLVDAPCSGVHMLWVGLFFSALLSYLLRASAARLALNMLGAVVLVLAGNVLRNTLLFMKEAEIVALPKWTHAATGVLVFLLTALLIAALTNWRPHAR
jgi:exosortase